MAVQPINCGYIPAPFNIICQEINTVIGAVNSIENSILVAVVGAVNTVNNYVNGRVQEIKNSVVNSQNTVIGNLNNVQTNLIGRINIGNNQILNQVNQSEANILNTFNNRIGLINQQVNQSQQAILGSINQHSDQIIGVVRSGDNVVNARLEGLMALQQKQYADLIKIINNSGNENFSSINKHLEDVKNSIESTIGRGLATTDFAIGALGSLIEGSLVAQTGALTAEIGASTAAILGAIGAETTVDLIGDTAPNIIAILGQLLGFFGLVGAVKGDVESAAQHLNSIWIKLQQNKYTNYDQFVADLNSLGVAGSLTQTLWNIGKFLFVVTFGTLKSFEPFIENIVRLAKSQANSERLTPAQILQMFHENAINPNEISAYLKGLGFSDLDVSRLIQVSYTLLTPDIIKFLYMQGKIPQNTHDYLLERLGYSDANITLIKSSYTQTPPIQDLITMAVREAFTPEVAQLFGQYEGYPTVLTDYTKRWGIDETWSKAYWAAHWRLPSAEEGFEMLHRGIIGQDTLKLLLRALDIMPFWREKVIELSYSPLRLVDIRRFFEAGVIDIPQMFKEYKSRGYDDVHAQWATNWTIQQASEGSDFEKANRRMLSQAVITKAFNAGKMTRQDAINALVALKYSQADANLIIDLYTTQAAIEKEENVLDDNRKRIGKFATDAYGERLLSYEDASQMLIEAGYDENDISLELDEVDYEHEKKIKAHISDWYRDLYIHYQIDRDNFIVNMSNFGFEGAEIERLLAEYDILRETRTRSPTIEQVTRWFTKNIITAEQFVNELKGLGFDDRYISYFAEEKGIEQ